MKYLKKFNLFENVGHDEDQEYYDFFRGLSTEENKVEYEKVKKMLDEGFDPNFYGGYPLRAVILKDRFDLFNLLIDRVDLYFRNYINLKTAFTFGKLEMAKAYLNKLKEIPHNVALSIQPWIETSDKMDDSQKEKAISILAKYTRRNESFNEICDSCGCDCENCDCENCDCGSQSVTEKKKSKPDFLDVDKDGDKKESMKKALKDKEKDKDKGLSAKQKKLPEGLRKAIMARKKK